MTRNADSFREEVAAMIQPTELDEIRFASLQAAEQVLDMDVSPARGMLEGAETVIILLKRLDPDLLQASPSDDYQANVTATHEQLNSCCERISASLNEMGFKTAWPGSEGLHDQKAYAVAAGMGEQGDSLLLLSYSFGPGVHIETIVTDAPVEGTDIPLLSLSRCSHCGACAEACPPNALQRMRVDRDKCAAYMGEQDNGHCGICMKVCPLASEDVNPEVRDLLSEVCL